MGAGGPCVSWSTSQDVREQVQVVVRGERVGEHVAGGDVNETKTGPLPVAEYSVLLMHSTPGKCWSVGELGAMIEDTGFAGFACCSTAADRTAIVARKPA